MEMSTAINELAAALAKAQGEMRPAKMGSVNPFLKNKYADLGEVIEASRPALTKNGLSVVQSVSNAGLTIRVTTVLMHTSGQYILDSIEIAVDAGKGMSVAQSIGSVITYLRRYSLAAMVGIYADDDTDGNEAKLGGNGNGKAAQPARSNPEPAPAMVAAAQELGATVASLEPWQMTSDGVPYDQLTTPELGKRHIGLTKRLEKNGLDEAEKALTAKKLEHVEALLARRNGNGK